MAQISNNVLDLALGMPKAELHLHIEGTLEPQMAFALAQRNKVTLPYNTVEELQQAYDFHDLQSFLDLYYSCAAVLITRLDFHDLMLAYLRRAHADNLAYAEVFFDPQTHVDRGISIETVILGLQDGIDDGKKLLGMTARLVMCFLRHLPEDACIVSLQQAKPYLKYIAAFGLDSGEKGNPPSKFARLFAQCRDLQKPVVAHAGEEGPAAYITEALDLLKVRRVDHGVRILDDAAVVTRVASEGVPITVCPLSNVRLKVFKSMKEHNLPALLAAGIRVTINSDDPAYFGGYMNDNIRAVQEAFNLSADDWYKIARNSFEATFAPDIEKQEWIARLDKHFGKK